MEGLIYIFILFLIAWLIYRHVQKLNERHEDSRGYYRNGYGELVHRRLAWKYIYSYPKYSRQFRYYDIHHIDGNKKNNSLDNLAILTREEHQEEHSKMRRENFNPQPKKQEKLRSKWEYGTHHNKSVSKITRGSKTKRNEEEERVKKLME
jgi:hypothetical protein